ILQEYFVPFDRFTDFVGRARQMIRRHRADLLNVTVRDVEADTDTYLRYASGPMLAIVMLFDQPTTPQGDIGMRDLTRDLIDLSFLHGRIVQEQGRRAVSPDYGPYEYDAILRGLASAGFVVISEVRPRGTEAPVYADRVVGQVRRLLDAGVPSRQITVLGASMG